MLQHKNNNTPINTTPNNVKVIRIRMHAFHTATMTTTATVGTSACALTPAVNIQYSKCHFSVGGLSGGRYERTRLLSHVDSPGTIQLDAIIPYTIDNESSSQLLSLPNAYDFTYHTQLINTNDSIYFCSFYCLLHTTKRKNKIQHVQGEEQRRKTIGRRRNIGGGGGGNGKKSGGMRVVPKWHLVVSADNLEVYRNYWV